MVQAGWLTGSSHTAQKLSTSVRYNKRLRRIRPQFFCVSRFVPRQPWRDVRACYELRQSNQLDQHAKETQQANTLGPQRRSECSLCVIDGHALRRRLMVARFTAVTEIESVGSELFARATWSRERPEDAQGHSDSSRYASAPEGSNSGGYWRAGNRHGTAK
jgi:hypothetical protein